MDHAPIGCPAPVHSSVAVVFDAPPNPIADVLFPPDPLPSPDRPLFKSVVSVQADPFHNSVLAFGAPTYILPPKTIADV